MNLYECAMRYSTQKPTQEKRQLRKSVGGACPQAFIGSRQSQRKTTNSGPDV